MNNMYIIPANSKNGKLIFNIFRGIDLVVFLCGVGVSLLLFVAIQATTMATTIIKILPISVCTFLVVPVPFYHNVMCFIKELYLFLASRRVYYWKGWCVRSEYSEK
jgi:hypothetical protein